MRARSAWFQFPRDRAGMDGNAEVPMHPRPERRLGGIVEAVVPVVHLARTRSPRTREQVPEQAIREARSQLVPSPFPKAAEAAGGNGAAETKKPRRRGASPEVELGGLEPPTSWVRS